MSHTILNLSNEYGQPIELDIPIEEIDGEEWFSLADLLKANQKKIADDYLINPESIFELSLLYAEALTKDKYIRQKFRFNKMLFYIKQEIEKNFGVNSFIFDKMQACRAGPIPINLANNIKQFEKNELVEVFLVKDAKRVPESHKTWEQDKSTGSITCKLTSKGEELAEKIWNTLDSQVKEIITEVKRNLIFLDTEQLKDKVHSEYPELKRTYTENDNENDFRVNVYCS